MGILPPAVQVCNQSKLTRVDHFFLDWLAGIDTTLSFNYRCLIVLRATP